MDVKSTLELEFTMGARLSIDRAKGLLKSKDTNYSQKNIKVEDGEKYMLNPYSPQYPADPEHFANRNEIITYFKSNVISFAKTPKAKPVNFAILGDWGVGKTSVIYKFQRILIPELSKQIKSFNFIFALTPQVCEDLDNFFQTFLNQLKEEYTATAGIRDKLKLEIEKWTPTKIPIAGITRKDSTTYFAKDLENLWKKHLKAARIDAAFLFLDDVHHFLPKQRGAYETLRNVFQSLAMKGCKYSLTITGPKIWFTYIADKAEPFVRFFHPFSLDSFNLNSTKEAIMRPLESAGLDLNIQEKVINEVQKRTGGHPYFVIYTMRELLNNLGDKKQIEINDFEEIWPKIISSLEETKFGPDFGVASEEEKRTLQKIARTRQDTVTPSMVGIKDRKILSRLENKGLLVKMDRGKYRMYHPLFKEYVRKQSD